MRYLEGTIKIKNVTEGDVENWISIVNKENYYANFEKFCGMLQSIMGILDNVCLVDSLSKFMKIIMYIHNHI